MEKEEDICPWKKGLLLNSQEAGTPEADEKGNTVRYSLKDKRPNPHPDPKS